jgi:hypothetical protein
MVEVVDDLTEPVHADAGQELRISVPPHCPITGWAVRAFDPSNPEAGGGDLLVDSATAGVSTLTFTGPEDDSIIAASVRFAERGTANYFWLMETN